MATATQGKTKDSPSPNLQHPLGVSHALQYLPHLRLTVSFAAGEFSTPLHFELSRFLLERWEEKKKSPTKA